MNSIPLFCYVVDAGLQRVSSPTRLKDEDTIRTSVEPDERLPESFLKLLEVAEAELASAELVSHEESEGSNSEFKEKIHKKRSAVRQPRRVWTENEDQRLIAYIASKKGKFSGKEASEYLERHLVQRNSKQCRDRYFNHLNPELTRTRLTEKEKKWIDKHAGKIIQANGKISVTTLQSGLQRKFKILRGPNCLKNYFYSKH